MNPVITFTRFFILSIFSLFFYLTSESHIGMSVLAAVAFGALSIGFDRFFKQFTLRSFNIISLGLFLGYVMGQALCSIFTAILKIGADSLPLSPPTIEIIRIAIFLFGTYLGVLMTLRYADEISFSIPFLQFTKTDRRKKNLLIDSSLLSDTRIIDLAASGLLDAHLVLPRFILKELHNHLESTEEYTRIKAKRALDVVRKLEEMSPLGLRYIDTDFPNTKDSLSKLIRLGRLLHANILTADVSQIQVTPFDGLRLINLHDLSKALKPLMQTGERVKMKIQRFGKEPRQGIGYLEDGTMVVVNGGGDFIGEVIDAHVLSVKHTSSGRMVFCNALPEENFAEIHGAE